MIQWLDSVGPMVWRASWQAAVLALLVAILVYALGERLTPAWRLLLWSVVVARLVIVATPASPWSLYNLLRVDRPPVAMPHTAPAKRTRSASDASWQDRSAPAGKATIVPPPPPNAAMARLSSAHSDASDNGSGAAVDGAVAHTANTSAHRDALLQPVERGRGAESFLTPLRIAWWAWLCGCSVLAGRLLVSLLRLRTFLNGCRPVNDPEVLALLDGVRQRMGLRAAPHLLVTPDMISPCIVGAWRCCIVLPEGLFTQMPPAQLRHVLAHELAHFARGDAWSNWLLLFARTLHWFNPAAWGVVRAVRAEREAACDDRALAALSAADRRSYGATILELAGRLAPYPAAPGIVGLFSTRRTLARRVERIVDLPQRPARPLRAILAGGLFLLLALVGLTDTMAGARADEEPDSGRESQAAPVVASPATAPDKLQKSHVVRGQLVDSATKQQVADARVRLFIVEGLAGEPVQIAETASDAEGRFEFAGLEKPRPNGRRRRREYGIVAEAEGFATVIWPESVFTQMGPPGYIGLRREKTSLHGKVLDADGRPVQGASVFQSGMFGFPITGSLSAVTDQGGEFLIRDFPMIVSSEDAAPRVYFEVNHPDFPATGVKAHVTPDGVQVRLAPGCTLTGTVIDTVAGQPAQAAVVSAMPMESGDGYRVFHARADALGRFRLVVPEGNYNILAEAEERVAVAVVDYECLAGRAQEVGPLELIEGGLIFGRVLNARTGEPVGLNRRGDPIALGLYGPSHPPQSGIVDQIPLMEVQADGSFMLRAAPGENFPYFVNERGNRMAWDTREQEPVVVQSGQTTRVDLFVTPPTPPAEKMQGANAILRSLPDDPAARVERIILEFRKLNHTVDETEVWCLLMRELVEAGPAAVPALCKELDQTEEPRMLRRLGFALRAMGDARAVPALVRAIPKCLTPPSSDYGLLVADAKLTRFMQTHDLQDGARGEYFNFGRPVREIFGALHKLTGQDFDDAVLYSVMQSEDAHSQSLQQELYTRQARRWQAWWESHWREFTEDASYRIVGLADANAWVFRDAVLGPQAKVGRGVRHMVLSPPREEGTHFLDLDTRLEPKWPERIARDESPSAMSELAAWTAGNGVDLMCLTYRSHDGTPTYALRGFNMRLWEISPREARNFEKHVAAGEFPPGEPAGELFMHYDREAQAYVPDQNAAFIYMTREGGIGMIEVTDRVTVLSREGFAYSAPPRGVGFHKGVRFDITPVVRVPGAGRSP